VSWIVASLHDVATATAEPSRRWMEFLEARGMRVSMLVVPGPWRGCGPLDLDWSLGAWLRSRQSAGHDIAQHGWSHAEPSTTARGLAARTAARIAARGCAEFWHLDRSEADRRLALGRAVMTTVGLTVSGFVAPGWLMSPESRAAIAAAGFRYTTTHTTVSDLVTGRVRTCSVLSQRPASSIAGFGAAATRHIAEWQVRRGRPLRIAVHPSDLDARRTTAAVLGACDVALDAGYRSVTYDDLVRDTAITARPLTTVGPGTD
jgi:predicted deacetylase